MADQGKVAPLNAPSEPFSDDGSHFWNEDGDKCFCTSVPTVSVDGLGITVLGTH
jgi:hypothetical protein